MLRSAFALAAVVAACMLTAFGSGCSSFGSDGSGGVEDNSEGGTAAEAGGSADGGASRDGDAARPLSTDPGVSCGPAHCDPGTSLCCTTLQNGGEMACLPKADASACASGATHECDDGADCSGGTVCCSTVGSNGKDVFATSCTALVECRRTSYWVVLCDPAAAAPCPDNVACAVPDGGGYGFCDLAR